MPGRRQPPPPHSMHHLILIREIDQQASGAGCCGLQGDVARWDSAGQIFAERRKRMDRMGEIYRAVRASFPKEVEISVVDPRNFLSLAALVARDAFRFSVPFRTAAEALTATSVATGIFDGEVIFKGAPQSPDEVVAAIAARILLEQIRDRSP